VARQYGFRGGLVPGVTVYAYMVHPVVEVLGSDWVERGTMSARFASPCYEGELVTVEAEETQPAVLRLEARGEDGTVRATGEATLPSAPPNPPALDDYPPASFPSARPAAGEEAFRASPVLGTIEATFRIDRAPDYLDEVADDHELWRHVAHPGYLLRSANGILTANFRLGPWIHISSDAAHFRAVRDGERVSTRARVVDVFERRGHRFVILDVVLAVDRDAVMQVTHTAIYEPRTIDK
jgi:acyl dehydratase